MFLKPQATRLAILSLIALSLQAAASDSKSRLEQGILQYLEGNTAESSVILDKELADSKSKSHQLRVRFYLAKLKVEVDPESAVKLLRPLLKEQEESLGLDHPDCISTARLLSRTLSRLGTEADKAEAQEVLEQVLQGEAGLFGREHQRVMRTAGYFKRGGALPFASKSASAVASAAAPVGKDTPLGAHTGGLAPSLFSNSEVMEIFQFRQGLGCFRERSFERAHGHLKSAVALLEKKTLDKNDDLGKALLLLGKTEKILRLPEAGKTLRAAIQTARKAGDLPTQLESMMVEAQLEEESGTALIAQGMLSNALRLSKLNELYYFHALAARKLSQVLQRQNKISDAYKTLDNAMNSVRSAKSANDYRLSKSLLLYSKAELLLYQGRTKEAELLIVEAKDIDPGDDFDLYAIGHFLRAELLFKQGSLAEAKAALLKHSKPNNSPEGDEMAARTQILLARIYARESMFKERQVAHETALKHAKNSGNQLLVRDISDRIERLRAAEQKKDN